MTIFFQNDHVTIHQGDAISVLRTLPEESVQTVVTSPPYWGLRDYGVDGQIGLEENLQEYIDKIVLVFSHVWQVLKEDGTVWLNMGDCFNSTASGQNGNKNYNSTLAGGKVESISFKKKTGLKPKDLIGLPWRVAFALQNDGWTLRSDIIWNKPNPMPESVRDRPTRAHEYIFLLSKSEKYFYDADAIRQSAKQSSIDRWNQNIGDQKGSSRANGGAKTNGAMKAVGGPRKDRLRGHPRPHTGFNNKWDDMSVAEQMKNGANKRSVWTVPTKGYPGAHFATFPAALIEPCILAGSAPGDTVLDPFAGTGTTCEVAERHGRKSIAIELNPDSCELAVQRFKQNSFCYL